MNLDRERRLSWRDRWPTRAAEQSLNRRRLWIMGVVFFLSGLFLWRSGPFLWRILTDEQALESFIAGLGWLGPVALIAFNAVQIVVAPIPGYVVQVASGFLFGPLWGGVWASIGLLLGATLSMWLSRRFGRPLAERLVGGSRLDRWESVTHSDSVWVWLVLILTPTGDLPYFLAGLARVRFSVILLLTLAIRVPTTFVAAAAGGGVMLLNWWQLAGGMVLLVGLLIAFMRYQDRLTVWLDGQVQQRASLGADVEE